MARVLILGAAGFIGSNLAKHHLQRGDDVIGIDDFSTGSVRNIPPLLEMGLEFVQGDLLDLELDLPSGVDYIYHLASPASPPKYLELARQTMDVNTLGTRRLIDHAGVENARLLFASTSEVYGDPLVHPQRETYWGNVNPIGPRSVYDESKRFGETLISYSTRSNLVDAVIIRIFNTYGPNMDPFDGRVVSTFIRQTLEGNPLTVFGSGNQTRSFCYIDDLVRGIVGTMESDLRGPINLGNPAEFSLNELAEVIFKTLGKTVPLHHEPLPIDDPQQRQPDISLAVEALNWNPEVELAAGVLQTSNWMKKILDSEVQ